MSGYGYGIPTLQPTGRSTGRSTGQPTGRSKEQPTGISLSQAINTRDAFQYTGSTQSRDKRVIAAEEFKLKVAQDKKDQERREIEEKRKGWDRFGGKMHRKSAKKSRKHRKSAKKSRKTAKRHYM